MLYAKKSKHYDSTSRDLQSNMAVASQRWNVLSLKHRLLLLFLAIGCIFILNFILYRSPVTPGFLTLTDQNAGVHLFTKLNLRAPWYEAFEHEQISDVGDRLNIRLEWIQHICKTKQNNITKFEKRLFQNSGYQKLRSFNRYLLDEASGIGVCLLPKSGSHFWNVFYSHLANSKKGVVYQQPALGKSRRKIKLLNPVTLNTTYPDAAQSLKLYVFARDPWDRMVSLYRQKVEFGSNLTKGYIRGSCGAQISTFLQLVSCIAKSWDKGNLNEHWAPVVALCDLCSTPYKYYGRIDKSVDEATYMFQTWNFTANPKLVLEQAREGSIRKVEKQSEHVDYSSYYKDIPESMIKRLQAMYAIDILMFGWKRHPIHG